MKIFFALFLCMLVAGVRVSNVKAQKNKPIPEKKDAALTEEEKLAAERTAFAEKATQMLKGKEWTVYVTVKPATENKPTVIETDTFTFTERTVLSKNLSARGYARNGSNYSLSVSDDGSAAVWETMQLHENEKDIVFLRGELNINADVMAGGIVYKNSSGKSESHSYTTIEPIEAVPAVIKQPEEPKKSKKGEKR